MRTKLLVCKCKVVTPYACCPWRGKVQVFIMVNVANTGLRCTQPAFQVEEEQSQPFTFTLRSNANGEPIVGRGSDTDAFAVASSSSSATSWATLTKPSDTPSTASSA
uniref:Uncharacterized protein n=1 Tax=Phytophthora ramorum TaxID=164328 RepID=H3H2B9_PHYRM